MFFAWYFDGSVDDKSSNNTSLAGHDKSSLKVINKDARRNKHRYTSQRPQLKPPSKLPSKSLLKSQSKPPSKPQSKRQSLTSRPPSKSESVEGYQNDETEIIDKMIDKQTTSFDVDNPGNICYTLQCINQYFNDIVSNKDIMRKLPHTQFGDAMTPKSIKLEKELNELVKGNKMSDYTHSSLLGMFNSLQSKQYDQCLDQVTDFIKNCRIYKQEPFALHRKWIMTFQSIVRMAKKYNI